MTDAVPLVAVVETSLYLRHCAGPLNDVERQAIVDHLAANPADGDLVPAAAAFASSAGVLPDGASGAACV